MKGPLKVGLAAAALVLVTTVAEAAPIVGLFNTGVLGVGVLAPPGTVDLHYDLILAPGGFSTAFDSVIIPASYQANGPDSLWIGPDPNLNLDFSSAAPYVYQTTFTIPAGFDPTTAVITGLIASDDSVAIFLNGAATGVGLPAFTGTLTPFIVNNSVLFAVGVNTLDFQVLNTGGGPTGLRVEMTGTVSPAVVPEPATLGTAGCGLLFLALMTLRRRGRMRGGV